ncbi:MAG: hypothetical protein WA970_15560, partial [Gammaproteobacteria bacterium]
MSKASIHDRWGRLAWQVPLVASAITFLLATGFSISNEDIRPGVQAIGLALLALWTVMGFGLTAIGFRTVAASPPALRHATTALVLNTLAGCCDGRRKCVAALRRRQARPPPTPNLS